MRVLSNGVNGRSGAYLLAERDVSGLAERLHTAPSEGAVAHALNRRVKDAQAAAGVVFGADVDDLGSVGWAVIIPQGTSPEVVAAIRPLIDRRREQAGGLFRPTPDDEYSYHGESKTEFLTAIGAPHAGRVEPDRFPYYVLLVGGPEKISFQFEREMSIQHAVGRIAFDEPEQYSRYVAAVLSSEERHAPEELSLTVVAARHDHDEATQLSTRYLAERIVKAAKGWEGAPRVRPVLGAEAHREAFLGAFSDDSSLVFTAGHGVGFGRDDPEQHRLQGALLTSSWQAVEDPLRRSDYVAGCDVGEATPSGKIFFNFACFSTGTPMVDSFGRLDHVPTLISDRPFVASLPKELLSHRNGGALACVGHVDRAWGFSFVDEQLIDHTAVYRDFVRMVLAGRRVGNALEPFAELHAEASSTYLEMLRGWANGLRPDEDELVSTWVAAADAGGFAIMGDPAVRLAGGPA